MTAAEFEDCIWDLGCYMEQLRDVAEPKRGEKWLLSMDSDSAHIAADLHGRGIWSKKLRFFLPVKSPDMHKAVEHVHGFIETKHNAWRRGMWPQKPTVQQCMDKVESLFYSYPPSAVQADIDSLPETYEAIIHNAGLYPPKPFR